MSNFLQPEITLECQLPKGCEEVLSACSLDSFISPEPHIGKLLKETVERKSEAWMVD